ncbi:uncharacterized protein [Nicotiana tomentosiformis]|uniref:uncharacterized protein n=1 Tax=Nicotiana tomentosiformis TaxID=4098 RepID=UPI00388C48BC
MYWCFSFKPSDKLKTIRVVHLNGYVEDFDYPISVSEVIGKPQNHFIFTQSQLLSTCLMPLNLDYILEQGNFYFLLPHSTFQSSFSPIDFAQIARKLGNIAKNPIAKNKSRKNKSSNCTSPVWNSPASSPNRFSSRGASRVETEKGKIVYGVGQRMWTKSPTWKPLLDTIQERSFNRRTESELQILFDERNEYEVQEKNLEVVK